MHRGAEHTWAGLRGSDAGLAVFLVLRQEGTGGLEEQQTFLEARNEKVKLK